MLRIREREGFDRMQSWYQRFASFTLSAASLMLTGNVLCAELTLQAGPPTRASDAQLMPYRILNSVDGLPQNTVYAMAEGPDGRIYVGTQDGLTRFDGVDFESILLSSKEVAASVLSLSVSGDSIWVGTDESGLWVGDGERWHEVTNVKGARLPSINSIQPRRAGGVWIGTKMGLFECDIDSCRFLSDTQGMDVPEILEGFYAQQAVLWIAAESRGLFGFALSSQGELGPILLELGTAQGLANPYIRALKHWNNDLWIGTGRGLARLRGETVTTWKGEGSPLAAGVFDFLPSRDASNQEVLLVASFGGGLVQFERDDQSSVIAVAQGLPENHIYSLLQTRGDVPAHSQSAESPGASLQNNGKPIQSGPIWIGTASSGIARTDPGGWVAYTERNGLPHRSVVGMGRILFPDRNQESYWLGTISGAVRLEQGRWQSFLPARIADRPVYDIAARTGGGIWLATDQGLFRWDGRALDKFSLDNSAVPAVNVLDLERHNGTGAIWLATRHGVATIDGDAIKKVPDIASARNLDYVAEIEGGSMFIIGDGVSWVNSSGVNKHLPEGCLAHQDAYSIALAPKLPSANAAAPELWVSGRGGITRVRFGTAGVDCQRMDPKLVASNWVFQLLFDRAGDLHAFGYRGALKLHVAELNASSDDDLSKLKIDRFDRIDGLPDMEFNRGAMLDEQGRVWAANVGGATIYDPAAVSKTATVAPLIFSQVQAGKNRIRDQDRLPFGAELSLSYRLLSYTREARILYRTQLVGLEMQPTVWTRDASRNFARLPGGDYQFTVWARDAFAREHGPITMRFSVANPWWRNPWLLGLMALGVLYLGVRLGRFRADVQRRKAIMEAHRLELQVEARTQELNIANVRLEKLALTDPLTGCFNRRCFYERYLSPPSGQKWLVVLLDIDHFKQINDLHGHAMGDAVLVEVGKRLQQTGAPVFRMGGEEFMLLEPAKDPDQQRAFIASLLKLIAQTDFVFGEKSLHVSASLGASCFPMPAGLDGSLEQVIRIADQALYAAKHAGRNRGYIAVPEALLATQSGHDYRIQKILVLA